VNDNVVVEVDWFDAIATLDICELVTFSLIVRSTVAPLSVVAGTMIAAGVGEGELTGIGETVGLVVVVGVNVAEGASVIAWVGVDVIEKSV
jgi:hypothetical protein